jgi:biofilm protein TabA
MILALLSEHRRYARLHPDFPRAFEFLLHARWDELAPEHDQAPRSVRHALDGDRIWASIDHVEGRGDQGARLEAHRRYIDIQFTIEGNEEIGWKPLANCVQPAAAFDEAKDVGFFSDRPDSWVSLPAGHFAIFFPEDAHAPLAGCGPIRKAIVKIAVE